MLTQAQHIIKQYLLHYPSLHGIDKWKVVESIAFSSPCYGDWADDGTFRYQGNLKRGVTPYKDIVEADLTEALAALDKATKEYATEERKLLRDLNTAYLVRARKYLDTLKFLNENIDLIATSPVDILNNYVPLSHHMRPEYVSLPGGEYYSKTVFFDPPANLGKDWGEEFADFGKLWLMSLRTYYGVGREGNGLEHWPEKPRQVHMAVQKQIIHFEALATGRTKEEVLKQKQEFAAEIQKILDDTK